MKSIDMGMCCVDRLLLGIDRLNHYIIIRITVGKVSINPDIIFLFPILNVAEIFKLRPIRIIHLAVASDGPLIEYLSNLDNRFAGIWPTAQIISFIIDKQHTA